MKCSRKYRKRARAKRLIQVAPDVSIVKVRITEAWPLILDVEIKLPSWCVFVLMRRSKLTTVYPSP